MSNERWIRSKITVEGEGMTHWYECRFRGPWGEFSIPVNGDEHADAFLLLLNNGEAYPALVEAVTDAIFAWDHAETSDLPEPGGDRCSFDHVIDDLRALLP